MTNCWSEGALRAYLDRELPAEDMKSVAAHLGECSSCDALCAELAGRAARVFALLDVLPEPERVMRRKPEPVRALSRWLWPGVAAAVAAGLAILSWIAPKKVEPRPVPIVRLPSPAPPEILAPVLPPEPLPASEASAKPSMARAVRNKQPTSAKPDYFLALDDQPIESGVIMRVAFGPGKAQADIVFDPGGRARAIRLVSSKY